MKRLTENELVLVSGGASVQDLYDAAYKLIDGFKQGAAGGSTIARGDIDSSPTNLA